MWRARALGALLACAGLTSAHAGSAAVVWFMNDPKDRHDPIHEQWGTSLQLVDQFLCEGKPGCQGFFGIPTDRIFHLGPESGLGGPPEAGRVRGQGPGDTGALYGQVWSALDSLKGQANPSLVIYLAGHGSPTSFGIGPDYKTNPLISFDSIVGKAEEAIRDYERAHRLPSGSVTLQYMVDTCTAGGFKSALSEQYRDPSGTYTNRNDGYHFGRRVNAVFSAPVTSYDYGKFAKSISAAVDWLNRQAQRTGSPQLCGINPDDPYQRDTVLGAFASGEQSTPEFWSTYQDYSKTVAPDIALDKRLRILADPSVKPQNKVNVAISISRLKLSPAMAKDGVKRVIAQLRSQATQVCGPSAASNAISPIASDAYSLKIAQMHKLDSNEAWEKALASLAPAGMSEIELLMLLPQEDCVTALVKGAVLKSLTSRDWDSRSLVGTLMAVAFSPGHIHGLEAMDALMTAHLTEVERGKLAADSLGSKKMSWGDALDILSATDRTLGSLFPAFLNRAAELELKAKLVYSGNLDAMILGTDSPTAAMGDLATLGLKSQDRQTRIYAMGLLGLQSIRSPHPEQKPSAVADLSKGLEKPRSKSGATQPGKDTLDEVEAGAGDDARLMLTAKHDPALAQALATRVEAICEKMDMDQGLIQNTYRLDALLAALRDLPKDPAIKLDTQTKMEISNHLIAAAEHLKALWEIENLSALEPDRIILDRARSRLIAVATLLNPVPPSPSGQRSR